MFVSSADRTVMVWRTTWGRRAADQLFDVPAAVQCLEWAGNAATIIVGLDDGSLISHGAKDFGAGSNRCGRLTAAVSRLAVSPDARFITAADVAGGLYLAETGPPSRMNALHTGDAVTALAFASDGAQFAVALTDRVELWDPITRQRTATLPGPGGAIRALAFDPTGARLAVAGDTGVVQLYDATPRARDLDHADAALLHHVAAQAASIGRRLPPRDPAPPAPDPAQLEAAIRRLPEQQRELSTLLHLDGKPLAEAAAILGLDPARAAALADEARRALGTILDLLRADPHAPIEFAALPAAAVALADAGRAAPLALILDLLRLTGGQRPTGPGARLIEHPRAHAWARPSWSPQARVALALLLLGDFDDPAHAPPAGTRPGALAWHLARALAGPVVEPTPTTAVLAPIEAALAGLDDRLATLIDGLGPVACANDPGLPLRLLPRLGALIPMALPERRLMGLRLPAEIAGRAETEHRGFERAGVTLRGDPRTLLPSQWALPEAVLDWRHAQGGLLYRARTGREAPRLRPTVLVLDVTPASLPIEGIIRPAAFTLARTLLDAGVPAWLIAAGGRNTLRPLVQPADVFEILTAFSDAPIDCARTARQAARLCDSLRDGALEPVVVVMSHPWFAADDPFELPDACGLFVRYGAMDPPAPPFAARCARSEVLGPFDLDALTPALARLLA